MQGTLDNLRRQSMIKIFSIQPRPVAKNASPTPRPNSPPRDSNGDARPTEPRLPRSKAFCRERVMNSSMYMVDGNVDEYVLGII